MAKKILATLLSVLLIAGMVSFSVSAEGAQPFTETFDAEENLAAWQNNSTYGAKPIIDTTVKHEGAGSAYFGDDALHSMYKTISSVEPGTTYAVSFYVKAEGTPDFYVYLAPKDWSGVGDWHKFNWTAKPTSSFEYVSFKYTTPTDGSVASFVLAMKQVKNTGKIWIDKLTFAETDSLLDNVGFENVSSVAETENLWAEAWNASCITQGAGDYRQNQDADSTENLTVVTKEKARSGKHALKVKTKDLNGNSYVYQSVSGLESGALYEVSAWVLNEGVRGDGMGAGILVEDVLWTTFGSTWTIGQWWYSKVQTGVWTKMVVYFRVPEGKNSAYIKLLGHAGKSDTLDITFTSYFDDIVVKKVDEGVTVDLSDTAGKAISNVSTENDETTVRVTTTAVNASTTEAKPLCVVYGIYKSTIKGTQLTDFGFVHTESLAIPASGLTQLNEFKDINVPKGHEIKVMAFGTLSSLAPLTKVKKLS